MRFRKNNRYKYGQDRRQHVGIPSGVDFTVVRLFDRIYILTVPGHGGLIEGAYGNGPLFVWGLTSRQRKRFEREAAKSS